MLYLQKYTPFVHMAHTDEKRKAIKLRMEGYTYGEIKKKLRISKSTLSNWLNNYPLTENQISILQKRIKNNRLITTEKIIQTKRLKRERVLTQIYNIEKSNIIPLTRKELYIAGLMLYWGEGVKGGGSTVSLCNTDPSVLKFYIIWLLFCLGVPKRKLKISLHLYNDMNINNISEYWSSELDIPRDQFIKPYIKQSDSTKIDHRGFQNGTCGVYTYNAIIKRKIMAGIKVIGANTLKLGSI